MTSGGELVYLPSHNHVVLSISAIQMHLNTEPEGVCLDRICPLGSTRRVAALTFATVLRKSDNVSSTELFRLLDKIS